MSALKAPCHQQACSSSSSSSSRPRAFSRGSSSRAATRVQAVIIGRPAGFDSKGRDRPWIEANGQPILAPRTADMAGDPFGLLLRQRIVFLGGEVEDFGADALVSHMAGLTDWLDLTGAALKTLLVITPTPPPPPPGRASSCIAAQG